MEIERKFLPTRLPENLDQYASHKIAQAYLCTSPVVRIRKSDEEYYLTYKSGGLMAREEYNLPLDRPSFYHLLAKADGRIIEKTRYLIPLEGGLTAELDVFEGDLAPLVMLEVEFESIEQANRYAAPDWFGEDVTNDGRYHNSYMSLQK